MNLATGLQTLGIAGQTTAAIRSNIANANAAKAMAQSERDSAAYSETQDRRSAAQTMARAKANMAAGGVEVTSGTPLLLQLDSARQAEMEALNIRRTGQIRAAGYKTTTDILGPMSEGLAKTNTVLSQWMNR